MHQHSFDKTESVRLTVFKNISLIITLVALVVAYVNVFMSKNYVLGFIELALAFFCIYTYHQTRTNRSKLWHRYAVIYTYFAVVLLAITAINLETGISHWVCTLPVLVYLLFGKKHGFISSFSFLIVLLLLFYVIDKQLVEINFKLIVNLSLTYIIVWGVSHVFESMRASNQEEIINLALRDSLTQAYNRRAFKSHFHTHIDLSKPYCFALADLDFFKKVNDKYGHDAGDAVLVQLTQLFKKHLGDEHVYRFGGEEFTLVVNDDIEVAIITMDKLRTDIQNHQFTYMQSTLNITISIGLVGIDRHQYTHLSEILRLADNYLYLAKNNGRNCVVNGLTKISNKGKETLTK